MHNYRTCIEEVANPKKLQAVFKIGLPLWQGD